LGFIDVFAGFVALVGGAARVSRQLHPRWIHVLPNGDGER
jgi:hypothetical protein